METLSIPLLLCLPILSALAMSACYRYALVRAWIFLGMSLLNFGVTILAAPAEGYASGGWAPPLGIELGVDALSKFFLVLTAVIFIAASAYHLGMENGKGLGGRFVYHLSFPLLLLSLNGLYITGDFFNFYVFFELLAISSYLLVAMGSHNPLEAAWKYAVLSILASIMLLAGTAFLYGFTGSLNMTDIHARLEPGSALWLAPFFLFALLTKAALFPFHVWQPDAHAGATTSGSIILAGVLINVGLFGIIRIWPILFDDSLRWILLAVGASSLFFGALAAGGTQDAKRLLGYSSTSQLGFIVLGIAWGTQASVTAAIFYVAAHSVSKSLLFAVTGILGKRCSTTLLAPLTGSGSRSPYLNAAFFLGIISLVGLPPAAGFVAKLSLFQAGVAAAEWIWIAGAVVGTLLTLVYGMRVYQHLFWKSGEIHALPAKLSFSNIFSVVFLAAMVLLLFFYAQPTLKWAEAAAQASIPRAR